jgi:CRISPR-associated protein (TIGR03986 family)
MTRRRNRGQRRGRQRQSGQRPQTHRPLSGYRFLNPYNFVRALAPADPEAEPLLGRCPPPPHDRYVGLTGRIECELTAETPLFIADSERVWPDPDPQKRDHYHYEFFKYGGEEAIPATSLRGVIRSIFEAATNSCFAVFEGKRRLEFREQPSYGNKVKDGPGIVRKLPQLVEDGRPATDGTIVLCQRAKIGAYYEGDEAWKNALGRRSDGRQWHCGDQAIARAKKVKQGYVVRELREKRDDLDDLGDGEEYIEGWVMITGKVEGTNKKSEYLFLDPSKHGDKGTVAFGPDEMAEYNLVLAGQIKDLPVSPQSPRLTVGDLVWVETTNKDGQKWARRIVRVQVPRVPYKRYVANLLHPQRLQKCTVYDELCPACRVFGWVWGTGAEGEQTPEPRTPIAYAGRVRFSYGRLAHKAGAFEATLAILSTPKPTTTRFYLIHQDGQPRGWTGGRYDRQAGREDEAAGYDGPNVLRGRKFYRHHGSQLREQEYERAGGVQNDQNRTVHGVLEKGSKFTFTVHFENLAPVELGALLWALEMEDGWHHRLGLGKPLGFGSVRIKIKDAGTETLNPETRYAAWEDNGWSPLPLERRQELVRQFKQAMADRYSVTSFEDLDNIRNMKALLTEPPELPIHYPRPTQEPQEEGKNYEWFVGNKRGGRQHGPRIELPLPTDERQDGFEGLPLLNDRGDEVQDAFSTSPTPSPPPR